MGRSYEREQNPYLAGEEGTQILNTAMEKKKLAHEVITKVYDLVPAEFHKHIRLLSQKEKLIDKQFQLTPEQKSKGLQSYYGKTYVETFKPYFDVEGRIEQMIAVHKEHGASYTLDTYPEQINDVWVMTCTFEGLNKHGQPFKTKERSIIGFGGSGVDASNPIENASTSAVGRALAHGGYGNIGSGLSSFEDSYIAISRQKAIDKLNNEVSDSKGSFGGQGTQSSSRQQPQGRGQTSQGSEQMPPAGYPNQGQQRTQPQTRPTNAEPTTGGQNPGNQEKESDIRKEKNILVGRLMDATKGWAPGDLKTKVQTWLNISWNGRFNTLDVGQMRLIEEHLKAEKRNSQAS